MKLVSLTLGACLFALALFASPALAAFEITEFDGLVNESGGAAATQAGSHPFEANNLFTLNLVGEEGTGEQIPEENIRNVEVELPPGLVGNPQATPKCANSDLVGTIPRCPVEAQVGVVEISLSFLGVSTARLPLYNMEAPPGSAAEFGFNLATVPIYLRPHVRTGGDYGISFKLENISQALSLSKSNITFWGVPGDPAHDRDRGIDANGIACAEPGSEEASCAQQFEAPIRPFVTNPTACSAAPLPTLLHIETWQQPGVDNEAEFDSHDGEGNPVGVEGCAAASERFKPAATVKPTTTDASSESGLAVDLELPQTDDTVARADVADLYAGSGSDVALATPALRTALVTLPKGMTINPAVANGVSVCTQAQIALDQPAAATCPEGSKLGTTEIVSPLFDHPLEGSIYLAKQGENKFGALLAVYLAYDDPATGTVIKLPGRIAPDGVSGQLTASFDENPQLPFSEFKLDFFGGKGAALMTPEACGTYETVGEFSPWSGAKAAVSKSTFTIDHGAGGGACPAANAFAPTLHAGSANPVAGQFSPFVLRLSREEGSQRIASVSARLPQGLLAKLAGIPYCADAALAAIPTAEGTGAAQLAAPSCPAASQVGTVSTGLGAGTSPLFVNTGKVYLAGPYKGAPLSLAIAVPALAGPFDLGNVVIRAALQVDPETAQVNVVADPIPAFLQGIPLDVRTLTVDVNRAGFTLNPSSCDPTAVAATATSPQGTPAALSDRFQVGNCGALGFAPRLSLSLKGGTTRAAHPALRASLSYPSGAYANIAKVAVLLPHSEFLENAHLNHICTRVLFAANQCPASSIYGRAVAKTPLLDQPLEGPVYLRASGRGLPDLVADLNGQIRIDLVGRIDSVHQGIRTTFQNLPDAPISQFTLSLLGGRKGLLVNSTNLCTTTHRANVQTEAHNGKVADFNSVLAAGCRRHGEKGGRS